MSEPIALRLLNLFQIGLGPSSSHTVGPMRAARLFRAACIERGVLPTRVEVELKGSLSATGRGHGTDKAVLAGLRGWEPETCDIDAVQSLLESQAIEPEVPWGDGSVDIRPDDIRFLRYREYKAEILPHPNTMVCRAFENDRVRLTQTWCSVGGGFVRQADAGDLLISATPPSLPRYPEMLRRVEEDRIEGVYAPLARAQAYAFAVNEENAAGGRVVTAPTNGAAGIVPAVLVEAAKRLQLDRSSIHNALATAGAIGMLVKTHASISGAEVGCQGEIGTATAMAAAALCQVMGGDVTQVENAAEIAIEHNLGLTCDPIRGLVQAPCIERNAMGVAKAWSAAHLSLHSVVSPVVSLDRVIRVMKRTGDDMRREYKETSEGGLAVSLPEC